MDGSSAVGEYLRARRDLIQPEDVGFPREARRRVQGLRREEVARLAGISPEYYLRLEQGRDHQPSSQVLDALARALRLNDVARTYMYRLARPASSPTPCRADLSATDLDEFFDLIGQWTRTPAFIFDGNFDVVLSNDLAARVGDGALSMGANLVLRMFSSRSRSTVPNWEVQAAESVAALRMLGDPRDSRFQEIVGELSLRSADFRGMWARQDVHVFTSGTCSLLVEPFGLTKFRWQNFQVPGHDRLTLTSLYAPAGSPAVSVLAYAASQGGARVRTGPA